MLFFPVPKVDANCNVEMKKTENQLGLEQVLILFSYILLQLIGDAACSLLFCKISAVDLVLLAPSFLHFTELSYA